MLQTRDNYLIKFRLKLEIAFVRPQWRENALNKRDYSVLIRLSHQ